MNSKTGFWSAFGALAGGVIGATAAKYAMRARSRHRYDEGSVNAEDAMVLGGAAGAMIGAFFGGATGAPKERAQEGALGAPSYEDALESTSSVSNLEHVDAYGQAAGFDLTDAQLAAPIGNALSTCGVPDDMSVTVKVAVKNGRAVGVTVEAPNDRIAACVDRAVRRLRWPSSPRLDSFTTRF